MPRIELGNQNCLPVDSLVIRKAKVGTVLMMTSVGCQICYDHVEIITSLTALCTVLAVFILVAVVCIQEPLKTITTAEHHSNIGSRMPSTTRHEKVTLRPRLSKSPPFCTSIKSSNHIRLQLTGAEIDKS